MRWMQAVFPQVLWRYIPCFISLYSFCIPLELTETMGAILWLCIWRRLPPSQRRSWKTASCGVQRQNFWWRVHRPSCLWKGARPPDNTVDISLGSENTGQRPLSWRNDPPHPPMCGAIRNKPIKAVLTAFDAPGTFLPVTGPGSSPLFCRACQFETSPDRLSFPSLAPWWRSSSWFPDNHGTADGHGQNIRSRQSFLEVYDMAGIHSRSDSPCNPQK